MSQIRLDKFISERTEYSRSQIKQLVSKGEIKLNNAAVKKSDLKIDPDSDTVTVSGKVVSAQRFKYILLNKPQGYVCSTDEKDGRTVLELVPPELRSKGLFPAGRLDKDSHWLHFLSQTTANLLIGCFHQEVIYPKFIL